MYGRQRWREKTEENFEHREGVESYLPRGPHNKSLVSYTKPNNVEDFSGRDTPIRRNKSKLVCFLPLSL